MATTLVSTGIQFPDGTTQTSAATGGMSASATSTTVYHNYPNHPYQKQNSQSTVTIGAQATVPRVDVYTSRYNTQPYGGNPYTQTVEVTAGSKVMTNTSNNMPSQSVPYPPANYSSQYFVKSAGYPTDGGGSRKSQAAWRVSYHNIT